MLYPCSIPKSTVSIQLLQHLGVDLDYQYLSAAKNNQAQSTAITYQMHTLFTSVPSTCEVWLHLALMHMCPGLEAYKLKFVSCMLRLFLTCALHVCTEPASSSSIVSVGRSRIHRLQPELKHLAFMSYTAVYVIPTVLHAFVQSQLDAADGPQLLAGLASVTAQHPSVEESACLS